LFSSFSSLLVVVANDHFGQCDLGLGGLNLAFLVLASFATIQNLLGHDFHVD
jgi:hypothetical protein